MRRPLRIIWLREASVRPSASPAGTGFFFVEKKDKTLHPCIDYLGLNDIRISLLEKQLFVKAEKCECHRSSNSFLGYVIADGNVQMDSEKVKAVVDWPQCFLG